MTLPIAPIAGLAATLLNGNIITAVQNNDWVYLKNRMVYNLTGVDDTGKWDAGAMLMNWSPMIAGVLVHKFIGGSLGVNRMLAKSKVPYVRV